MNDEGGLSPTFMRDLGPSIGRRLWRLFPPTGRSSPVPYNPRLLTYVGCLAAVSSILAVSTVRLPTDWGTLVIGALAISAVSASSVTIFSGVDSDWSVAVFLHLGLILTLGPIGALGAALMDPLGSLIRYRTGWFRMTFNVADHFLADMSAWAVFRLLAGGGHPVGMVLAGGLAAGGAQWFTNYFLMGGVVRLTGRTTSVWRFLRSNMGQLPYSLGYGWSAYSFVVVHQRAGAFGFTTLLTPVLLLQGFLVFLGRRIHVHELARAQHAREREELLQRIIDASEEERRKIASDLHDGPVQNLAGAAMTLSARAGRLKARAALDGGVDPSAELMEEVAQETRIAMRDLRTLIIQIAPPSLESSGLEVALGDLLVPFNGLGITTRLESTPDLTLHPDRVSLIFRVAQEALRNVAKYAEPKNVSIVLKNGGEHLTMTIADDGKGFSGADTIRRRGEGHVGLSLLAGVVSQAGGTLEIDSSPGRGTTVTLNLAGDE